jgi:hypothetical protein
MRADYDSEANAISIDLADVPRWDYSEEVTDRINVALLGDRPVNVEVLYPSDEACEDLRVAAARYELDAEALIAALRAALAAPDRVVTVDVGVERAA